MYQGYMLSSTLVLNGLSFFIFSSAGNCMTVASGTPNFSFKFGQNVKISCRCVLCGTPLMFSQIMGSTIPQFLSISNNNITIPTITDSTMTSLTLNIAIGRYGSQQINYIDRVSSSYTSDGGNIRTLMVNFYALDNIVT